MQRMKKEKNTNPDNEKEAENTPNVKEIVLHCEQCGKNNFKTITGLYNHKRIVHKHDKKDKPLKGIKRKTIDKSRRLSTTLSADKMFICIAIVDWNVRPQ